MASLLLHLAWPSVSASAAEVENPPSDERFEDESVGVETVADGDDVGWILESVGSVVEKVESTSDS